VARPDRRAGGAISRAQRLYGRRGYIPDGLGACRGQRPLNKGMQVTMDDDLIIWPTKDLAKLTTRPHFIAPEAPYSEGADAKRYGQIRSVSRALDHNRVGQMADRAKSG
jgi:hypothetical protein